MSITLSCPHWGYSLTKADTLLPGDSLNLRPCWIVPDTAMPGERQIFFEGHWGADTIWSTVIGTVRLLPPVITVGLSDTVFACGDSLVILIANDGSVTGTVSMNSVIKEGWGNLVLIEDSYTISVPVGQIITHKIFIPEAKSGRYVLKISGSEQISGQQIQEEFWFYLKGKSAGLTVTTDRDVYLLNETAQVSADIRNQGEQAFDSKLRLYICPEQFGDSLNVLTADGVNFPELFGCEAVGGGIALSGVENFYKIHSWEYNPATGYWGRRS